MTRMTLRSAAPWRALLVAAALLGASAAPAWAFDVAGYRSRLDTVLGQAKAKAMPDAKAAMAQLDEMVALGKAGAQEYAVRQPKFAKLMDAAIAASGTMKDLTDAEIEDKWGENGNAGDAAGVPLQSLGQFDETRGYLELMVGPSHAYIFLKKYASTHKSSWLDKAADELTELGEHLKVVH